jgi:uncharacterized protein (DUF427 family)
MSLTVGTGPFGHRPTGRFDFAPPAEVTFVEQHARRVRATRGGDTVVDSERVCLVYRTGSLPRYAFPSEDVLIAGDPEPAVENYVTVPWGDVDHWYEEDEEVIVHPRDPYHRIEILASPRTVVVRVMGQEVARSSRPLILFETALPPRYYLPLNDVRTDLLRPADRRTGCAYKGYASYFTAAEVEAIAWTYLEPRSEAARIQGRICFFQEREEVELEVDGLIGERPATQWSKPDWAHESR